MATVEQKLGTLAHAILDLAEAYDEKLQPEYAEMLRGVANDRDMLVKFAGLLAHYDTPAAAAEAMLEEGTRRVVTPIYGGRRIESPAYSKPIHDAAPVIQSPERAIDEP